MKNTWSFKVPVIVLTISAICGLILIIEYDNIANAILYKKYQISNGSDAEALWADIPVPMSMKVYFFNITNPDDVKKGAIPKLQEVGPYVYKEVDSKENLRYHDNMTVSYMERKIWIWDQESSANLSENDLITMINSVAVSSAHTSEKYYIPLVALNTGLNNVGEESIITQSVLQILFEGFEDPLLTMLQETEAMADFPFAEKLLNYDKFAWFYKRNDSETADGVYNMYTGESSLSDVGKIDWWNYSNETEYFDSPCNQVTGSAGQIWPPGLGKDYISFYSFDLCMSPKMFYLEDITDSYGNPGYRYYGSNETFANATYVPENKCYCVNNKCPPTGLLSAESCRMGSPAYVSFPHFIYADPQLRQDYPDLKPDPEKHMMFLDINPDLGVPLNVAARMQINLKIKPYPGNFGGVGKIDIFETFPDTIVPLFWFEVLAQMTDETNDLIKPAIFFCATNAIQIIFSVILVLNCILLGVIVMRHIQKRMKEKLNPTLLKNN